MGKTFLVAVDYSKNATRAVNFVADTFSTEHKIILLGVLPKPPAVCDMDAESLAVPFLVEKRELCQMEYENELAIRKAVENAKKTLMDAGFPEASIQEHLKQQQVGIARDIVSEAQRLKADMIILGRRGLSGIKEFFLGSVSQKVLQLAKDKSVLLVQ